MELNVPDDILKHAQANATDIRLAIALQLYADNRIDHDEACRLAKLSPAQFNRELIERDITVQQYPTGSLRRFRRNAG